jgi:hypothetical protein
VPGRLLLLVSFAALVAPAPALAHGRGATVALDYRLRLAPSAHGLRGVHLRILDGDRSLQARVDPGVSLVVRGYLREPVIRIGDDGVWVNASSPTAQADKLVTAGSGWVKVKAARSFAWHDHRLSPPPLRPGARGQTVIPIAVDGRTSQVTVLFHRIARPPPWPWAVGAAALLAAIAAVAARRALRGALTLGLALVAGLAAVLGSAMLAVRDQPDGRVGWLQIGAALAIGAGFAAVLALADAHVRSHAAGIAGAVAAAASLSSLPVFWHAVVVSALPGTLARLACGLALLCGAAAAVLSFLPDFDERRRVTS